jgi:hypothetical protein
MKEYKIEDIKTGMAYKIKDFKIPKLDKQPIQILNII